MSIGIGPTIPNFPRDWSLVLREVGHYQYRVRWSRIWRRALPCAGFCRSGRNVDDVVIKVLPLERHCTDVTGMLCWQLGVAIMRGRPWIFCRDRMTNMPMRPYSSTPRLCVPPGPHRVHRTAYLMFRLQVGRICTHVRTISVQKRVSGAVR